jgi:hypothetical protein
MKIFSDGIEKHVDEISKLAMMTVWLGSENVQDIKLLFRTK